MYKREFENLLHQNTLPKSILFYGSCLYQNNLFMSKMLSKLDVRPEEKLQLYYDEYNLTGAKNFLSQASLFGDRNILIIKTDTTIPKKDLDQLVQLCHKNEGNFFIFQFFGEDKKAKNMEKSFSPKVSANFVRFFRPNQGEALMLLDNAAKDKAIKISKFALAHLFQLEDEDIGLCINDLDKLAILDKEIEVSDIDNVIYGVGTVSMDKFITELLQKKDISHTYTKLMESGSADEVRIINAIQTQLAQLFMFQAYIKTHGKFNPKEILGYPLPPQIANERSRLCMMIDLTSYKAMLDLLFESELKLKKMQNIDKNALLLSTLIKLQTFL
ncbi:DNA polymerase III subunit delta [Sulfurospirillum sp. 1612]|uniref:DNA polymerase III subunit delta n=1 Tax=Sulfurospirillum sp. 1612 TaxID=3094835 RepID=UPI002F9281F9